MCYLLVALEAKTGKVHYSVVRVHYVLTPATPRTTRTASGVLPLKNIKDFLWLITCPDQDSYLVVILVNLFIVDVGFLREVVLPDVSFCTHCTVCRSFIFQMNFEKSSLFG